MNTTTGTTETTEITPFRVEIPQADLDDLHRRLAAARFPRPLPGAAWERGVPVDYLRDLAGYWRDGYDWRRHEARLNEFPQFTTTIDGQRIHFLHVRSPNPDATPLLLIHGWPGSVVEFLDSIEPLTNPEAHGGEPADAFHVVIPSIPGHGFSTPLSGAGWTPDRIAAAFAELMHRVGYDRYGVQGGDQGAFIGPLMGRIDADSILGIHVNAFVPFPGGDPSQWNLTDLEQERMARFQHFHDEQMGYVHEQSTRPQTLAYGLTDSPVGQLAWIVEKFKEWTDAAADRPDEAVDRDALLTNVSLYWFTATAGEAANLYYEVLHQDSGWDFDAPGTVPTGVLVAVTADVAIRQFAERDHNIVHWTDSERGGHFFALEQPGLFVDDVRKFFGALG
jgi:pimeloyl-ACP methyl ester carboxylesterase